jgi:hypothetical protein
VVNFAEFEFKRSNKLQRLTPELNVQIVATQRSDCSNPKLELQKSALQLTESSFLSCKEAA